MHNSFHVSEELKERDLDREEAVLVRVRLVGEEARAERGAVGGGVEGGEVDDWKGVSWGVTEGGWVGERGEEGGWRRDGRKRTTMWMRK